MVWRRLSVPIACALGPLIILAAILRNWHGWAPPPFWLDDFAAGLLVLAAGIFAWQEQDSLRGRLLSAAMALCAAVLWGSGFETLAGLHPLPDHWTLLPSLALILTVLAFALALGGLAASLPSKRKPMLGTRPEKPKARR